MKSEMLSMMIDSCIFYGKSLNSNSDGSLGVVKNIEFKIVAYLPRFFILIFVKFYVFVYRILLYSMV